MMNVSMILIISLTMMIGVIGSIHVIPIHLTILTEADGSISEEDNARIGIEHAQEHSAQIEQKEKEICKNHDGKYKNGKCNIKDEDTKVGFDHTMEEKGLYDNYAQRNADDEDRKIAEENEKYLDSEEEQIKKLGEQIANNDDSFSTTIEQKEIAQDKEQHTTGLQTSEPVEQEGENNVDDERDVGEKKEVEEEEEDVEEEEEDVEEEEEEDVEEEDDENE